MKFPIVTYVTAAACSVVVVASLVAQAAGCTPAERAQAGGVVSTISKLTPLICQAIPQLQGSEVCAETTDDIAAIGQVVGSILTQFGAVRRDLKPDDLAPTHFKMQAPSGRAVFVTLPAYQAAIVQAHAGAAS